MATPLACKRKLRKLHVRTIAVWRNLTQKRRFRQEYHHDSCTVFATGVLDLQSQTILAFLC